MLEAIECRKIEEILAVQSLGLSRQYGQLS